MKEIEVKLINKSCNYDPEYATIGSAGMDLCANEDQVLHPGQRRLISTGIFIQLPEGYEAQVRPRSGLAIKHGITVLNSPGTIDSDYTGEIKVILINHSDEDFRIEKGDRIAQMVIAEYVRVKFTNVEHLAETERGEGGFGHSGIK